MSSLKKINKLLEKGLTLHQAGQLEQAEKAYREVLQKKPKNSDALNLLGVISHQTGRNEAAVNLIKKAILNNPNIADFHNNCGEAYRALGNLTLAIKCYEKAISLQSGNADAYNNLALSFSELSEFDKAISNYEKALSIKPNDVEIYINMGHALTNTGKLKEAINTYEKAIKLKPDFLEAYINLGNILNKLRQFQEAVDIFEKALLISPKHSSLHYYLGKNYYESNQIDKALNSFKQSLSFEPNNPVAHNSLALTFNNIGKYEDAYKHYEQALLLKPDYADPLYNLAILEPKQEYISLAEDCLKKPEISEEDKITYHFTLGILYEKFKSYEKTYENYSIANTLKRKTISYDSEVHSAYVDRLIKTYSKDFFQNQPLKDSSDLKLPIFILGMPRSGTTLVEQIISSHPLVHGSGELETLRFIEKIISKHADREHNYPENIAMCNDSLLIEMKELYLKEVENLSENVSHITDKMPSNFLRIGLIKLFFPKAKIIHCRRNAMDICTSIYLNYFIHGNKYSFDLIEIGKYYLDYEKLMKHWLNLFGSEIHEIQYEDLIIKQESISKQLIKYLNLEWDENCINFYENKRLVKTASNTQVRQPMYKSSMNRWKNYEKHIEPLKELLKDYT